MSIARETPDADKPITDRKIPGTDVPDVRNVAVESERQRRWMSGVAVSTAIMAALAAISTMFSGGRLNEGMMDQIRASDAWAYYQAKSIKAAILESRIEGKKDAHAPVSDDDSQRLARYKSEQDELSADAKAKEASADLHRRQYKSFSRAATGLQIGIGVAAVALLLRRNAFWVLALAAGIAGVGFLVQGLMLV